MMATAVIVAAPTIPRMPYLTVRPRFWCSEIRVLPHLVRPTLSARYGKNV